MHRHLTALPELTTAFMNEARIASLIRHPNVVSVHDVHEARGEHLLVMDYVDGTSLQRLMQLATEYKLPIARATGMHIVAQALRGLHAAHEQTDIDGTPLGVVHRDATLTTSWWLRRLRSYHRFRHRESATEISTHARRHAKGKFRYMAPEQARGGDIDRRVDVFALVSSLGSFSPGGDCSKATVTSRSSPSSERAPSSRRAASIRVFRKSSTS